MITAVGIVILIVGLIAWVGQSLSYLAPATAEKFGVLEPREKIDPVLYIIEAKAEGLTDMLLAWTLPLAAFLMLLGHPVWPYLGLIGGGVFLYVAGLITLSRFFLRRKGKKIGPLSSVRAAYLFGGIWAASAIVMIILSATHVCQ